MFDKLDIAVINLDRRPDRMACIHKNIPFLYNPANVHNSHNIIMDKDIISSRGIYRRFPAVDGKNLSKYYTEFDWLLDTIRDKQRVIGEVGCSLSHYSLWRDHAIAPNAEYLLIFEDDVLFTDESHQRMKDVVCELASASANAGARELDVLYVGGQWTPNYDIDGEKTYFPFQRTTNKSSIHQHFHCH